jgi:DNA-binding transcriptional ArsR family regulator
MDKYSEPLDNVFHALADPTRRAVIQRLGNGPASVSELAGPFDMALPSFMKHLNVLEKSGLIRSRKSGRVRIVEIKPGQLNQVESWLAEQRALWQGRTDRLENYVMELQAKEEDQ